MSGARYVYLGLIWLYVAGILVQVFLAGNALFSAVIIFWLAVTIGPQAWRLVRTPTSAQA